MKVLILLSFVALAFAELECGENSYYDECASECPLTCDNYKNPPQVCILQCRPICYCDEGYVKTKDGKCVKPEDCPINPKPVGKNCVDAPERGNCKSYIPTFYYDAKHKTCHIFLYGGCGGNGNRYASYGECMDQCGAIIQTDQNAICTEQEFRCKSGAIHCIPKEWRCDSEIDCMDGSDEEGCQLGNIKLSKTCHGNPETGLCEAYMPSWYYDVKTGTCKRFIYGGCGGNGNRYESNEECLNNCKGNELKQFVTDSERCHLPPEAGLCDAYMIRYYFDKAARKCRGFVYGGCGGNENNFKTLEECKMACK